MEHAALLVCRYGCYNAAVRIFNSMSYEDVVHAICEKVKELSPDTISLMYSLPSYPNCIIENTNDLENLFFLLNGGGLSCVVRVELGVREPAVVNDGCAASDSISSESLDSGTDDDNDDLLPSFYAQPDKVLFPANWRYAIREEGQKFEGGVKEFWSMLAKYSVERGFFYRLLRNNKKRLVAECKMKEEKGCEWYVRGREMFGVGFFSLQSW